MYPVSNHNAKGLCTNLIEERGPVALAPLMLGKPTIAFIPLINVERMGAILINASINQKLQANDTATLFINVILLKLM